MKKALFTGYVNPLWVIFFTLFTGFFNSSLACVPGEPRDLTFTINRTVTDIHVFADISWTYSSTCKPIQFRLLSFDPVGYFIVKETSNTHVQIEWSDICKRMSVQLMAFDGEKVGNVLHKELSFTTELPGPSALTAMKTERRSNIHTGVVLSWEDTTSPCKPVHYEVSYWQTGEKKVTKHKNEMNWNIHAINTCKPLQVELTTVYKTYHGRTTRENITFGAAPQAPSVITMTKLAVPQAYDVSWQDESECQATEYTVSIYNERGQILRKLTTAERTIRIPVQTPCTNMYIGITGRNEIGEGTESAKTKLHQPLAPQAPTTISIRKQRNGYIAWWKDASECKSTKYTVSLYNKQGKVSRQLKSTRRRTRISAPNPCDFIDLGIAGHNPVGKGEESRRARLNRPPNPNKPTDLVATLTQNSTTAHAYVNISWKDDSPCKPNEFTLVLREQDGKVHKHTTENTYAIIEWKDVCNPIPVELSASPDAPRGKTLQQTVNVITGSNQIRILAVQTNANQPTVTVFWEYENPCVSPEFTVFLYNDNEKMLRSVNSLKNEVVLENLLTCVKLYVSVLPRSELGEGPSSEKVPFLVDTEPTPTKLTATIAQNRTEANVLVNLSWTDSSACKPVMYELAYRTLDGTLVSKYTEKTHSVIQWADVCHPIQVELTGVRRNIRGQTLHQNVSLAAVPGAPVDLEVTKFVDAPEVNISWRYTSSCPIQTFVLNVYDDAGKKVMHGEISNQNFVKTSTLPTCTPLRVSIHGRNEYGEGEQTMLNFGITANPIKQNDIKVRFNRHGTQVDVPLTEHNQCSLRQFVVNFYHGNEIIQSKVAMENQTAINVDNHGLTYHVKVVSASTEGEKTDVFSKKFFVPMAQTDSSQVAEVNKTIVSLFQLFTKMVETTPNNRFYP